MNFILVLHRYKSIIYGTFTNTLRVTILLYPCSTSTNYCFFFLFGKTAFNLLLSQVITEIQSSQGTGSDVETFTGIRMLPLQSSFGCICTESNYFIFVSLFSVPTLLKSSGNGVTCLQYVSKISTKGFFFFCIEMFVYHL